MRLLYSEAKPFSDDLLIKFTLLLTGTSISVLLFGNLLLLDISTFIISAQTEIVLLLIIYSIHAVSSATQSLTWGIAITYASIAISILYQLGWVFYIVMAAGVFGIYSVSKHVRTNTKTIISGALLTAFVFGALVVISSKSPVSFDMIDRLELGETHRDTLFHASIASMIKTYGVISTGLNGLVETPYHILSHILIAAISNFSTVGILENYGLIPLLLFLPLLLAAIAYIAASFGNENHLYRYFILTGLTLAIAPRLLKVWGLKESYFGSESYSVALVLMLVSLPLLYKKTYKTSDLLLIPLMLALMTYAKASVGAIFIGLLLTRIIWLTRNKIELLKSVPVFLVSAAILFLIIQPATQTLTSHELIGYWQYVKLYSLFGDLVTGPLYLSFIPILLFISLHFIFSWLTIKYRINKIGIASAIHDPVTVYSLAAIFGGLLIVALPVMPGSITFYFSNVAMFASLPWFIIYASEKPLLQHRKAYLTAFAVILILKSPMLYEKSLFKYEQAPQEDHITFVETLLNLRQNDSSNVYFKTIDIHNTNINNPISLCMAIPFAYPAVTEKAWIGVIDLQTSCEYEYYGYDRYFKDPKTYTELIETSVPANTKVITINF